MRFAQMRGTTNKICQSQVKQFAHYIELKIVENFLLQVLGKESQAVFLHDWTVR